MPFPTDTFMVLIAAIASIAGAMILSLLFGKETNQKFQSKQAEYIARIIVYAALALIPLYLGWGDVWKMSEITGGETLWVFLLMMVIGLFGILEADFNVKTMLIVLLVNLIIDGIYSLFIMVGVNIYSVSLTSAIAGMIIYIGASKKSRSATKGWNTIDVYSTVFIIGLSLVAVTLISGHSSPDFTTTSMIIAYSPLLFIGAVLKKPKVKITGQLIASCTSNPNQKVCFDACEINPDLKFCKK